MKRTTLAKSMLSLCVAYILMATATTPVSSTFFPTVDTGGVTFYVGGNGLGNYTSIQQAIDNASDGDTIYVYNGTYTEIISIEKSITLTGEHKNGTVIDGKGNGTVVTIDSDRVSIGNITVTGGGADFYDAGVCITSDYVSLKDSIILYNDGDGITLTSASYCTLSHNIIMGARFNGIYIMEDSHFNNISYNDIQSGINGILVSRSNQQTISYNKVVNCAKGIYLEESVGNTILNNHLTDNEEGLFCFYSVRNTIKHNNFISNTVNARFVKFLHIGFIAPNKWDQNYWDDWAQIGVKVIFGGMYVRTFSIIGIFIPWIEVDWHPTHEPN